MITALSIGRGGLGRFGNQIFTIAGCIGIAVRSWQSYAFPLWVNHDAKDIFGTHEDVNIYQHLVNELPLVPDIPFQEYGYFWGYRDVQLLTGSWTIDAHMQSEKYFKHCIQLIRQVFTFKGEPEQNDYCAIHYRAGDYGASLTDYHPRQPKEYYERAVSQFSTDQKFLVFTDDQAAAREMFGNFDFAPGIEYLEDFKLMKKCKSFIGSNSSFPLMAAILADHPDKKMVFPELWFGPDAGLDTRDIYPEGSIVL